MGADDEIIIIAEKTTDKYRINYNVDWPGDEAYARENPYTDLNQQDTSRPLAYTMYSKDPSKNGNQKQQRIHYREYQPRIVPDTNQDAVKDDRLKSMKNRYFSVENKLVEAEKQDAKQDSEEPSTASDTTTSQAFLQRKDYLLKKLMAAHTLPGLEENADTTDKDSNETVIKPVAAKPMRVSAFQDEFIPLFNVNSNNEKRNDNNDKNNKKSETSESSSSSEEDVRVIKGDKAYNPRVDNLQKYQGPYSINCILRSRRVLIEELLPMSTSTNRSNYFDRRWEILKMKLDIKSKFDTDRRLRNKIQRETAQIQQELAERAAVRDRRFNYYNGKVANGSRMSLYDEYISMNRQRSRSMGSKKVFNDSDNDDDVLFFDEKTNSYKSTNSKWKSSENFIELAKGKRRGNNSKSKDTKISSMTLDENSPESDGDSSNEEEVIRMINQQEYCINAGTDSEDMDSKCRQFGKYGKKQRTPSPSTTSKKKLSKKRQQQLNKQEPNLKRRKSQQAGSERGCEDGGSLDGLARIDRAGLVATSQYEELKERYKTIRNKRNKVLRKKKGEEIELERKVMSDELRKIRLELKKLRRKNKFLTSQVDQLAASNPLDLVKNKDAKKPKARKIKEKKQKKQQNFQRDQESKRVKKKIKKNKKKDKQSSDHANTSRMANNNISNDIDGNKKKRKNPVRDCRKRTNKASRPGRMKTRLW